MKLIERLPVLAFALTFYCLGTTFFEAFVNYRTWPRIGAAEFPVYHQALTPLVVRVMLIPIAVYFLLLIALWIIAPRDLPRAAIGVSLLLVLTAIVSSVLIQIPIQRQLDVGGLSLPLLEKLTSTDLIYRKLPLALNALLWLCSWRRA